MALVFARDLTGPLTSLVKKIDQATAANSGCSMGSFVVFLGAEEDMEKKLKEFAEKENFQHTILTTMENPGGPPSYNVARKAEVTVVLYNRSKVEANFAFAKDELSDKDVAAILKDLAKILPDKK